MSHKTATFLRRITEGPWAGDVRLYQLSEPTTITEPAIVVESHRQNAKIATSEYCVVSATITRMGPSVGVWLCDEQGNLLSGNDKNEEVDFDAPIDMIGGLFMSLDHNAALRSLGFQVVGGPAGEGQAN